MKTKFKLNRKMKNIRDPYKLIALAVLQQAIADGDEEWLREGETLPFWLYAADIFPEDFQRAVDLWFSS